MRILNVRRLAFAMLTAALSFTSIAPADELVKFDSASYRVRIAPTAARPRAGRNSEGTTRHGH